MIMAIPESQQFRERIQELIDQQAGRPWTTREIGVAYEDQQVRVESHRVEDLATGQQARRLQIELAEAKLGTMVVVPRLPDKRLLFVVRYYFASADWKVEFPTGAPVPEEDNWRDTAQRVLAECTSLRATDIRMLGGSLIEGQVLKARATYILADGCVPLKSRAKKSASPAPFAPTLAGSADASTECIDQLVRRGDIDSGLTLAALRVLEAVERDTGPSITSKRKR